MNVFSEVRLNRYRVMAVIQAEDLTNEQRERLKSQDSYNVEGEFTVKGLGEYHYKACVNGLWVVDDEGNSIELPESDTIDYTYLEDEIETQGDPEAWYEDYLNEQSDRSYNDK